MASLPTGPEAGVRYVLDYGGARAVFNDPIDPDYAGALAGDEAVTGLDSAEIRESAAEIVEGDGGLHGAFYRGRRPITLKAEVLADTRVERNEMLTRISRATGALRSDATLTFTPSGSIEQFVSVRQQQPIRVTGAWKKSVFIPLVAADPRIYSTAEAAAQAAPGGTAENQGSGETFPTIRIDGPGTGPSVTASGQTLSFASSLVLLAGQYIDIDMHPARTSVVDWTGADRYQDVDWVNSTWWPLLPGNNALLISWMSGSTGASRATLSWRHAWI